MKRTNKATSERDADDRALDAAWDDLMRAKKEGSSRGFQATIRMIEAKRKAYYAKVARYNAKWAKKR